MERRSSVRFVPSEIARMEKLAAERKEQVFDKKFCQKLAEEFNRCVGRAGSKALQGTQVQGWFLNKFPASATQPTCVPTASQEKTSASEVMEWRSSVRFVPSEIQRMEKLAADRKEQVFDIKFCQKLAEEFNRCIGRAGSKALQGTQVRGWFLNKFPSLATTCVPTASQEKTSASEVNLSVSEKRSAASEEKLVCPLLPKKSNSASEVNVSVSKKRSATSEEKPFPLDTSVSNNEDEFSPVFPLESTDRIPELDDLEFEAKSAKDSAWYDICRFLAYRKNTAGEVEVLVRFDGFGAEEDEWVNVKKFVRERSIPVESSQCKSIAQGDLVLCFREEKAAALHFDAHVLDVERKQHDIRGCRCVFHIEYDHDQSQERVSLKRLSRRPKYFEGSSC